MNIFEEMYDLTHEELFDLICSYDIYVREICDRNDGSVPVCLSEYYENDYREQKEVVMNKHVKKRLKTLRKKIKEERISYLEIAELISLKEYINKNDVELLQWVEEIK